MSHRITIENLGPIKKITKFEVRRINAVIGESAAGKSLLAKAIYCFNSHDVAYSVTRSLNNAASDLIDIFDWLFAAYNNFLITYYYTEDCYVSVEKKNGVKVIFSKEFELRVEEVVKESARRDLFFRIEHLRNGLDDVDYGSNENIERLKDSVKKVKLIKHTGSPEDELRKEFGITDETIFIPANRSFVNDFDSMRLRRFYEDRKIYRQAMFASELPTDDMMLTVFSGVYRRKMQMFRSLSHPLMRGKVLKLKNQVIRFTVKDAAQGLDISEVSSGQSAMFPILMILQAVLRRKSPALIIIEEPEVNIYPEDQKILLDHIIEVANATGSSVFITTHSPYVLMAVNNLMKANANGYEKLERRFIKYSETTVGMLKEGKFENLIDPKDELIDLHPIESVDDTIIEEFEDILSHARK